MMSEQIKVPLVPECASCIVSSLKILIPLLSTDFKKQAEYFASAFRIVSEGYANHLEPVQVSIAVYKDLYSRAGAQDPYDAIKRMSTEAALKVLPFIEKKIEDLDNIERFHACLAAAVTGNVIDFNTAGHEPDLEKLAETFDDISRAGFAVNDSEHLWNTLNKKKGKLLYLADNAGEVILDIPLLRLIRSMGWRISFIVKGKAMVNDATVDDIRGTEIENLTEIADSGAWAIGVPLNYVSDEFLKLAAESDLVISKGQANIETFPEIQKRTNVETYYITRAKCPHISQAVMAKKGDNVVYRQPRPVS
ncbi:MAG: ARMT1-like domain-containing protein [Candidatus Thorarchaeota archaeon]|nr:ARMT1-like domain-containing protein [Candidatus Thorarchaeota archaeon]